MGIVSLVWPKLAQVRKQKPNTAIVAQALINESGPSYTPGPGVTLLIMPLRRMAAPLSRDLLPELPAVVLSLEQTELLVLGMVHLIGQPVPGPLEPATHVVLRKEPDPGVAAVPWPSHL